MSMDQLEIIVQELLKTLRSRGVEAQNRYGRIHTAFAWQYFNIADFCIDFCLKCDYISLYEEQKDGIFCRNKVRIRLS